MSYTYLFFKPKRLPLTAAELDENCVERITDLPSARAALKSVYPALEWADDKWGRAESAAGSWIEFMISKDATLAMNCSFRADYTAEVQRICDALGWIAVDQDPKVFQPRAAPVKA